ncbi:Sas10/Utp3/C1D family-domain-containing protein [Aspergillus ambiguus]|uniref:Sas10/Utp3/C1D family protein n=1 Tax=Aspergillus ambiguus TaxID=176160 RepID=UPI003CCE3076
MDVPDLTPLLEQLDDNVDDLEEVLAPILNSSLTETSKKLPVLDKAKFHVLVTYALESLIFSYLRLHGVNAKEHPVFRELTRVKQYFAKIKALETEPEQRTMKLDKEAAGRFIKHGLAGNDKLDMERKEQEAKEKARAHLRASLLAKKAGATPTESTKNPTNESHSEASSDESEGEAVKEKQKYKNKSKKKEKSEDATDKSSKKKSKRSKEGRKEESKERRKKKMERRKARQS